ncbi:MAG: M16 family metallopeptidase [Ignavibacteriales bacterium]
MSQKIVLPSGLRVIVEEVPNAGSVSIGVWIGAGSRHETPGTHGVSHFIEHMLFKGTARRSARDLAVAIEGRGGVLNAFTAREYTCVYAKVLSEDVDVALDVLSDMVVNPRLDPADVEREKGVVVEEIGLSQDTPDDLVHELAIQAAWPDHSLGRDVLGTCAAVEAFSPGTIAAEHRRRYVAGNMAVVAAGNCAAAPFIEEVERRFSGVGGGRRLPDGGAPVMRPGRLVVTRDTEQTHLCVVGPGAGAGWSEFYPVQVLTTIVGGGATSRLFQRIREERGLAYSIYTYESSFADCGLLTTYAGTGPAHAGEVLDAIFAEYESILRDGVSAGEVSAAIREIRGGLLLSLESTSSLMIGLGKSEMTIGRPVGAGEVLKRIESVTVEDVMNAAARSLKAGRQVVTAISPAGAGVFNAGGGESHG